MIIFNQNFLSGNWVGNLIIVIPTLVELFKAEDAGLREIILVWIRNDQLVFTPINPDNQAVVPIIVVFRLAVCKQTCLFHRSRLCSAGCCSSTSSNTPCHSTPADGGNH